MPSPLGLTTDGLNYTKKKAKYRYNKVDKKWEKNNNSAYEESLFNEGVNVAYFPQTYDENKRYNLEYEVSGVSNNPHSDDIYDIRTQSIIEWSRKQSMALRLDEKDFVYLKNLGVYPNNRLIICRKFGQGVGNDLSSVNIKPISTLISWVPPGEDFFSITFGEKWTEADKSFVDIFNKLGSEYKIGSGDKGGGESGLGTILSGGLGAVPLPGFTHVIQRKILYMLGLIDKEGSEIIPEGTPNLIKSAKIRQLPDNDSDSSGLNCNISIKVDIEYEQKFIGGLDPTKAFYDILGNIAQFGTQDAVFYLNGSAKNATKFKEWFDKLNNKPYDALLDVMNAFKDALIIQKESMDDVISDMSSENGFLSIFTGILKKYQIRIKGVVDSLVGTPSGPWHVTIGNPKRPLFTSGDMYCKDVTVTFGNILAFNDLPSTIKVSFTLENARPLGLGEIMSRFMMGQGRTYIPGPTFFTYVNSSSDYSPPQQDENTENNMNKSDNKMKVNSSEANVTPVDGVDNESITKNNETFSTGVDNESKLQENIDPDDVRYV